MNTWTLLPHPSLIELEQGIVAWERALPDRLRVLEIGRSAKNHPVFCLKITDMTAPDADKQIVLLTATHGGPEINPVTGLLHTAKWLLGDRGTAPEIRRKTVALIVPCVNPEAYVYCEGDLGLTPAAWRNSLGGSPTWGAYDWNGLVEPEKNPEAAALLRLMDEYPPDAHVDVHGTRYVNQTLWDTTGYSFVTGLAHPYCRRLAQEMDAAADAAGFFPIAPEDASGRLRVAHGVEGARDHYFCANSAGVSCAVFAYHRYHSIAFHFETGFDGSTLARLRRCLEMGLDRWRGEFHAGYPTGQVACWGPVSVAAYGRTSSERRRSRIELWARTNQMACGWTNPQPARSTLAVFCAPTLDGIRRYLAPGKEPSIDAAGPELSAVLERMRGDNRFDMDAIESFFKDCPSTHAAVQYPQEPPTASADPPSRGLALRLHIPYADAEVRDLRLDGHPLDRDEADGWHAWGGPGQTVQVNIPPGKTRDFHLVTCRYRAAARPMDGFAQSDWDLA